LKGVALSDGTHNEIIVYVGGFGASYNGCKPTVMAVETATGITTIFAESLRFGKRTNAGVFELQATHIATWLRERKFADRKLHIIAHSLGAPIAAIFADMFGREFRIVSVTVNCPDGVYRESFLGLGLKITRKIVRDCCSPEGRRYWGNSWRYFRNPVRSLREGIEASQFGATIDILAELEARGIHVSIGLAPDDDVFPCKKTLSEIRRKADNLDRFGFEPGRRHSPDFDALRFAQKLQSELAL
jgi:pimeloyl-ACP methyl ester carboxylesterase